jgi:CubicO group peptidase (beta-lactamase class C family)
MHATFRQFRCPYGMKKPIHILIVVLFLPFSLFSQDNRLKFLRETFSAIEDSLGFSGIIQVSESDSTLTTMTSGYANRSFNVPVSPDTKFRIASLSKPIISYAIYILADRDSIALDAPISRYLPQISKEIGDVITASHLIEHKSGLIREFKSIENGNSGQYYTRADIIRLINLSSLQSEPGQSYSYSNAGFSLLALIIENVCKQPLEESLNTLLFEPLDMRSTGHERFDQIIPQLATGYEQLGGEIFKSPYEDKSHVFGAGSLFSTASDLTKFSKELIKGTLLSEELHSKYLEDIGRNMTGGGWITWTYSSKLLDGPRKGQIINFGGSCPGFQSFMSVFLDNEITIIGLMNQVPISTSLLNNKIGNVMLGYDPETIYQPASQKFLARILTTELQTVLNDYENYLKDFPNESIKSRELNQLGYAFMNHHKMEEAIKIFTFMTMLFPDDDNAYDSLGEALIKSGDTKAGLVAYRKSLQLNPQNGNAQLNIERYENGK